MNKRQKSTIRWSLLVLNLCVLAVTKLHADQARMVLTNKENGTESQEQFTCDGKIHGYVRLTRREEGTHLLESRWTRPDGKVAADSRNKVTFDAPGRSTAYVWFNFPDRANSLGFIDPKSDELRIASNGSWKVEVLWDHKTVITQDFEVNCR